jgi:hypothetical protein
LEPVAAGPFNHAELVLAPTDSSGD